MILPQFTAPGYLGKTLNAVQRCVNLYLEKDGDGWCLVSAPGIRSYVTVGNNSACRGAYFSSRGRVFSAHDDDLYEISGGIATDRGNLAAATGSSVKFCDNNTYMLIVDGSDGYVYDLGTDTLTTISDPNFPASPNWCAFKDGYFIVTESGSDTWYLSALNDPSDWTPSTFAQAESSGDNLWAVVSSGNELLFIGKQTIEPWYNTGNAAFPFERISGGIQQIGTEAPWTILEYRGAVYLIGIPLGGAPGLYEITAGSAKRLSTPTVDTSLAGVSQAFIWEWEGHTFYQVNTPTTSWVYDLTTGAWHERSSGGSTNELFTIVGRADSTPYAFSRNDGDVFEVVPTTNTEAGTTLTRIKDWTTGDGARMHFYDRIEIVAEMDHDSSASYTASGTLSWSDDGGLSFNTPITLSASVTSGTTGQIVRFTNNRMGGTRNKRIWRWTMTTAARIVLKTCDLKYRVGSN